MTEVTRILSAIDRGEVKASEQLLPLVYDELRRLAAGMMAQERPGETLQPTALVHEAYLRLVGASGEANWNSRGHFFAAAAEAMRRILVDSARRKQRVRHGGGRRRFDVHKFDAAEPGRPEFTLSLNDALDQLASEEVTVAELVKLRYFAGLTIEESASALGISVRTANRHWVYAKAWLYQQLAD